MSNRTTQEESQIDKLVLDTHTLIWYLEGKEISESQVQGIEQNRRSNQLYISSISIWEVAQLNVKKKLALSIPFNEWLHNLLSIPGLNVVDLSISILVESCNLLWEHKDPVDRMVVATTRSLNARLFTFDKKILDYAENGYVKVYPFN